MPPRIALILCIIFIIFLFRRDSGRHSELSKAIWVPLIWMIIIGSRAVSQWLNLSTNLESTDIYLEGSPFDRAIFLILIITGIFILLRRKISWSQILHNNTWIVIFFLYSGITFDWSDFPFVSLAFLVIDNSFSCC